MAPSAEALGTDPMGGIYTGVAVGVQVVGRRHEMPTRGRAALRGAVHSRRLTRKVGYKTSKVAEAT